MEYVIVSVRDTAVGAYMRPFVARSRNEAVRMFGDEVNNKESAMFAHPEDYELWYVDRWDDEIGVTVDRPVAPEMLVRARDMLRGEKNVS